jgi:hypothetical protein
MGSLEKIIDLMDSYSKGFKTSFHFYLDEFNDLIMLQSNMIINKDELNNLNEENQNSVKAYGFLLETSNTTMAGVLRLLSGNMYSDSFSLIRILYEILCVMKYGNLSVGNRIKIVETFFKVKLEVLEQNTAESRVISSAKKAVGSLYPELKDLKYYLNFFGSHISRAKIGLGNVAILNEPQSSPIFSCNFFNKYFLSSMDMLFQVYLLIFEEYITLFQNYMRLDGQVIEQFKSIKVNFVNEVRPKLLGLIKEG